MKALYKFRFDCGRQGKLEGIFIAEKTKIRILLKNKIQVYFGEVLGKHSEVYGYIKDEQIIEITDNTEVIDIFEEYELESGYNPFHYNVINFNHELIEDRDWTIDELCDELLKLEK